MLWLADRVSKGEKVWDFQTSPCEVLYVSLEDTEQRIQQRLGEVTGGEADKIWIATEAELLGKGFEQQIGNFLTAHPNVGFVIVDTLQRIRQMKTEGYSYGGDYEVMTSLKTIADRFNITILVVHHTRKEDSDDSFNKISGTNGLLGCADGAMVLQKPSHIGKTATLDITGREVADLRLKLEFDETKRWQFIEYGTDQPDERVRDGPAGREFEQAARRRTETGIRVSRMAGHTHRTDGCADDRPAAEYQTERIDPTAQRERPDPRTAIRRPLRFQPHTGCPHDHAFRAACLIS